MYRSCSVFKRPFVKRFTLCYRSVVLSCLSACNVHALWPNGWTDQDETWTQVGLGSGHIVLDGDPAPPAPKGEAPPPIFGRYLLRPNGCRDRDATWHGGRTRPRRLCIRRGSCSPPPKRAEPQQIFGPCLLWPNGWMHQDAAWYKGRPQPRDFVLDGDQLPA